METIPVKICYKMAAHIIVLIFFGVKMWKVVTRQKSLTFLKAILTDGKTDGEMYKLMDGRTDGHIDKMTDMTIYRQTEGYSTDGQIDRWTDRRIDE
jgi:hypothetical protein